MIIIIEHEETKVSVERKTVVDIFDTAELLRGALVAVGFHPDTVQDILPEEE